MEKENSMAIVLIEKRNSNGGQTSHLFSIKFELELSLVTLSQTHTLSGIILTVDLIWKLDNQILAGPKYQLNRKGVPAFRLPYIPNNSPDSTAVALPSCGCYEFFREIIISFRFPFQLHFTITKLEPFFDTTNDIYDCEHSQ